MIRGRREESIEILGKKRFGEMMLIACGEAFLTVRVRAEAAHGDAEGFRFKLSNQLPAIAIRQADVANKDVEFGGGKCLDG